MKKNHIKICLFTTIIILHSATSNAQTLTGTSKIVQSPYYDAKALYYALADYSAYPVFLENKPSNNNITTSIKFSTQKNTGPSSGGNSSDSTQKPLAPGAANNTQSSNTVTYIPVYKIIESSTGKILSDTVTKVGLAAYMNSVKFTNDTDREELINEILARNDNTDSLDFSFLKNEYNDNIYLSDVFNKDKETDFISNINGGELSASNAGGSLPSVTMLAEGLADFYIERVNEEINDAFFVRLKEELEKFPELKILFPNTLESLTKIEPTKYNQILNVLKAAYETDIKNLLSNISGLATLEKYQTLINKHNELTLLFTTCDLINLIKENKSAADILYYINQAPYVQKTQPNIYNASIKLAALLSYAFTNVQIGNSEQTNLSWIGIGQIDELNKDDNFFKIFMGLIAQNAKGIKYGTFDFRNLLINNEDKIIKTKYIITNFNTTFQAIKATIENVNGSAKTIKLSTAIGSFIDISGDIVDLSNKAIGILPTNSTTLKYQKEFLKIKNEYIPLLQQADSVVYHIEKKEYSMATYKADTLLSLLFTKQRNDISDEPDSVLNKKEKQKQVAAMNNLSSDFLHYGLFISSVAEAKSADDIKQAINAFALPKGSSRIKKEHSFSWGLNSYVGFAYSLNTQYKNVSLSKTSTSITAPLGIAVNWNKFPAFPKGSCTLYGGIIDIGAIFTYKVNSDQSIKSDIELGQILSPSLGFIWGFPIIKNYNYPVSLGFNYQWGPTLRKVGNTENTVLPLLAGRANIFLAIDIPVINFSVSRK